MGDNRIYGLRDRGDIIALGGGVYRWSDAPPADLDLIEISERVPMATICLESALARHHLIDSIPSAIDIAIPGATVARSSGLASACTSSTDPPSDSGER